MSIVVKTNTNEVKPNLLVFLGETYHGNGNGDIFYGHRHGDDRLVDGVDDVGDDDLLPEDIPGLPRHPPGEMSPR